MHISQSNSIRVRGGFSNVLSRHFAFSHAAAIGSREICLECGEYHPVENIVLAFRKPDARVLLSELEPEFRFKADNSLCVLQAETPGKNRYYLRGVLPLPVQGQADTYNLGVWVEVPDYSYYRVIELWARADQANVPPFPGLLANAIPFHTDTFGLRVNVSLTGSNTCPRFQVSDPAHKLYMEQTRGISPHQAHEYSKLVA